ncbi:Cytochrome c peroxidase [Diplonema papillatum]|nr:Cytochrome c peroxidase [Diplonema papillatum]|eukprot:gene17397-26732_t
MFSRMLRSRGAVAALAFGTGTAFAFNGKAVSETSAFSLSSLNPFAPKEDFDKETLRRVRAKVAAILDDFPEAGPEMVRLAWHASGTFSRKSGDGGNHGTMDIPSESSDPANAGLDVPRKHLAPLWTEAKKFSKADFWVLAALIAINEMGGPQIPFYYGRVDGKKCPPTGRLPDASKGSDHIRAVFTDNLGFNDQEIVALMGAHAMGRCHADRSGFEGPWTHDPYGFSNGYYGELLGKTWVPKVSSAGKHQFEDKETRSLMMLPTDLAMIKDEKFLPWVKLYAEDNDKFCEDFSKAYTKLMNLSWVGLKGPITDY